MAGRGEGGEGEGEDLKGSNLLVGGRGNAGGGRRGEENRRNREIYNSFGFPIIDGDKNATMKNISPSVLPNFHGLKSEDPKTFLFEFEVLCRYYDYLTRISNT